MLFFIHTSRIYVLGKFSLYLRRRPCDLRFVKTKTPVSCVSGITISVGFECSLLFEQTDRCSQNLVPGENSENFWPDVPRERSFSLTNWYKEHRSTHVKTQVRKMWYYSVVVEAQYIVSKTIDCKTVRIQVRASSQTKGLEWGWKQRARVLRAPRARKTLTPRFTDFFTDFEKKPDCFAVY